MTSRVQNVDALINNIPDAQPIDTSKSPVNAEKAQENAPITPKADEVGDNSPQIDAIESKPTSTSIENEPKQEVSADDSDEYGIKVDKKPRMYTEEEVQNMIRDRLKRGAFRNEQQPPQQVQQPSQQQMQQAQDIGFEYNADSEQTWTQQLENFVRNTMQKVSNEAIQHQREAQERHVQAEFETKFYDGMAKYPDFVNTLSDKPVTNDMMKAIRGLDNPAAFLYAVAKKQPTELTRIANIPDPAMQMLEMGRLHERMVKAKQTSSAPRPLSLDRSDVSDRRAAKRSIEHLIEEHARERVRR